MRKFHVLGLSHTKTTKDFCCCAFTQKVRLMCKMLTDMGHIVYHYGTEGSDPICNENVSVLRKETFDKVHGVYDYKKNGFLLDQKIVMKISGAIYWACLFLGII